jgi:hypothetical protein
LRLRASSGCCSLADRQLRRFDQENRRAPSELIEFRSIQGQVIKNALTISTISHYFSGSTIEPCTAAQRSSGASADYAA